MRLVDLIRKKRDGQELATEEIEFIVTGYTRGELPDYQISAWLMTVLLKGMTRAETAALTRAQILAQASTTVLSQANISPQAALALLPR